jgi:hypothetical protein
VDTGSRKENASEERLLPRLQAKPAVQKTGSRERDDKDWQGSKPCSKRIGPGFPGPVRFVFAAE